MTFSSEIAENVLIDYCKLNDKEQRVLQKNTLLQVSEYELGLEETILLLAVRQRVVICTDQTLKDIHRCQINYEFVEH